VARKDDQGSTGRSELDAIAVLKDRIGAPRSGEVWIGDDMAVLRGPTSLLFATDIAVEGVHFRAETGTLADAGWKVFAANLSDVAAMGGTPTAAVVGLAGADSSELDDLYDGILQCAVEFDCPIVGGDLTGGAVIVISIAVVADAGPGEPVLRSGGRPGDHVFLTRATGASGAGLRALLRDPNAADATVDAHRRPVPRLSEGRAARRGGATAMIDVSDGLGLDLDRLCRASAVGVVLDVVPIANGATLEDALSGGEDYELVFTAPAREEIVAVFTAAGLVVPIEIGRLVADADVRKLAGEDFVPRGYLHDLSCS
jgi:thiamine-monophosphate kinase